MWRMRLFVCEEESALLYAANHAVSDQLSLQRVLGELIGAISAERSSELLPPPVSLPVPPSVEEALIGPYSVAAEPIDARLRSLLRRVRLATLSYAGFQLSAGGAPVLPNWVPPPSKIGEEMHLRERRTASIFAMVSSKSTASLRQRCRANGVTISGAVNAAALLAASDALGAVEKDEDGALKRLRYKLLQAINMRPYGGSDGGISGDGSRDWSAGSVLAGTGSLDLLVDLTPGSGRDLLDRVAQAPQASNALSTLWSTAKECNEQTRRWIDNGWPRESLVLFGAGWEFMNMNRVVELSAQDCSTLGRAYSCGTSNVGVYAHQSTGADLSLRRIFFGISQSVSAPAISLSCVTVDGGLCLTVQYCTPIWSNEQACAFTETLKNILMLAAAGDGLSDS